MYIYIKQNPTLCGHQTKICLHSTFTFCFSFLYRIQCFCAGLKNANETGLFVSSINKREFGKVFAISYDPNCESFKLNSQ